MSMNHTMSIVSYFDIYNFTENSYQNELCHCNEKKYSRVLFLLLPSSSEVFVHQKKNNHKMRVLLIIL